MGRAAHETIRGIGRALEEGLEDTPGEYFALHAGGMLFACETAAAEGVKPVRSMGESLAHATQIMTAFTDELSTDGSLLNEKAAEVYSALQAAAAGGIRPALLIGQLNDYLHYLENEYLTRRGHDG